MKPRQKRRCLPCLPSTWVPKSTIRTKQFFRWQKKSKSILFEEMDDGIDEYYDDNIIQNEELEEK